MKKLTTASELLKHDLDTYTALHRKWWKNTRKKPHRQRPKNPFKITKYRRDRVLGQMVKRDLAAGVLIFRG
ncbi:DUF7301 family protein [Xenorhabdus poinarii]|uniref:DUF7301 family protein n=1 Tax=Xenorhabdus poinarii TaxID=40577 RepID=UPI0005FA6FBA|nr:hypothetical protein [Xenorhabdus poinarii]